MRKKILSACLVFVMLMQVLFLPSCASGGSVTVLDRNGKTVAVLSDFEIEKETLADPLLASYLEVVLEEGAAALSEGEKCEAAKAKKLLFSKNVTVKTAFDPVLYEAVKKAWLSAEDDRLSFGCAMTDLNGNLLVSFSGGDQEENFASSKTPPYSSFKPLSVYMQALEKGLIHWSSVYEDSPMKKVIGTDGKEYDWPANATNTYTYDLTTVETAVMQSLNTVASKCLWDLGVRNSIRFLRENFGLSLTSEETRMNMVGEEEIIGNISMGHLYEGTSPIQMAGFYQCFANGGVYVEPRAITEMTDGEGNVLYTRSYEERRVMTPANARIMNLLLQKVVSPGGTGARAAIERIPVGGKTGTGDYGNWFVGFTPEYTCSVWHGMEFGENLTTELFREIFSEIPLDPDAAYPESDAVKQGIFCTRTGLLLSKNCKSAGLGYYETGKMPVYCKD